MHVKQELHYFSAVFIDASIIMAYVTDLFIFHYILDSEKFKVNP